jgi:putative membrane protein
MTVMGGMVLFWAIVILGIVWLIRGFEGRGPSGGDAPVGRERPVEILERRFAEGAISPEEYWARRQVLDDGKAEPSGARSEVPVAPGGVSR